MKPHASISICLALLAGLALGGCVEIKHVPPGQSLSATMARKPEAVEFPAPSPAPAPLNPAAGLQPAGSAPTVQAENVADDFTLGNLCMQQGRYPEAIAAYEAAVQADPSFAEAWNNLAIAYQNIGDQEKAIAAFKKYKMIAAH